MNWAKCFSTPECVFIIKEFPMFYTLIWAATFEKRLLRFIILELITLAYQAFLLQSIYKQQVILFRFTKIIVSSRIDSLDAISIIKDSNQFCFWKVIMVLKVSCFGLDRILLKKFVIFEVILWCLQLTSHYLEVLKF